jgi:hypothetical protein
MKTKFTITATGNDKTKTFDIVKLWDDGEIITYRTCELSPEEYEEMEYNTASDWVNFLNTSQSYYVVNTLKNTKPVTKNLITKQQFMEFFRSEEGYIQLSADDCIELFSYALKGSSDITKELLDSVLEEYGVENLKIVEL